jgi:hypothetical protein
MSARSLPRVDVRTAARHEDARLRGRTYAIPFEDVWQAALALASGAQRGWTLVSADDSDGIIIADVKRRFPEAVDRVVLRISLDADAQTRVDAEGGAWGDTRLSERRTAKQLDRLFRALDRTVELTAEARQRSAAAP